MATDKREQEFLELAERFHIATGPDGSNAWAIKWAA
jgi:hypothetical protein